MRLTGARKKCDRNLFRADGETHKGKTVYTPLLRSGGIKLLFIFNLLRL